MCFYKGFDAFYRLNCPIHPSSATARYTLKDISYWQQNILKIEVKTSILIIRQNIREALEFRVPFYITTARGNVWKHFFSNTDVESWKKLSQEKVNATTTGE